MMEEMNQTDQQQPSHRDPAGPPHAGRPPGIAHDLVAVLWLAVIWGLAAGASLVMAAVTELGPVVYEINSRHGVHLGDLLAVALFTGFALVLSWMVISRRG